MTEDHNTQKAEIVTLEKSSMSTDSDKLKKGIRKMNHWFRAIEHESKMLDFPDDVESLLDSWSAFVEKLQDEQKTMVLKFLYQARLSWQENNETQFRIWFLRAKKIVDEIVRYDNLTGGPAKRKGGAKTAAGNRAIALERAVVAADQYDKLTSLNPRDRAAVIARQMDVTPATVRRYLRKTNRR